MSRVSKEDKTEYIKKRIVNYPNFPKPGILFSDIFGILRDPQAFTYLKEIIIDYAFSISPRVHCVVGLDARGFLLAPIVALALQVPFVPIRKQGKLPGKKESVDYLVEYGSDTIEIQKDSIQKGDRVLLIDDLLATGGTLAAALNLIEKIEAKVACCMVVVELTDLKGRDKINAPVYSIVKR